MAAPIAMVHEPDAMIGRRIVEFSFVATSLGTLALTPLSRSTHSCSVCAVQPIWAAIDETAAQRE